MNQWGDGAASDDAAESGRAAAKAFRDEVVGCLEYWMRAARSIAEDEQEAQDLVQDAVLRLFEMSAKGQIPETNLRAYGATIMRNSYVSSRRSPRVRRAGTAAESSEDPSASDDVSAVELGEELAALGQAMRAISPEHREVLTARFVEGLSPRELVDRLGRNAAAISNLLARAKQALRRALLAEHLARGGEACKHNADRLPPRVQLAIADHGASEPGIEHASSCDECRKHWRAFAAVTSALGIIPLLIVFGNGPGATPAEATAGPLEDSPDTTAGGSAQAGQAGQAGQGEALRALAASPVTLGVGVLCVVTAAGLLAPLLVDSIGEPDQKIVSEGAVVSVADSDAHYEAEIGLDASGALDQLVTRFWIDGSASWQLDQVALNLPQGTGIDAVPAGLDCVETEVGASCTAMSATALNEPLVFTFDSEAQAGEFTMELQASSGARIFQGEASGTWHPGVSR